MVVVQCFYLENNIDPIECTFVVYFQQHVSEFSIQGKKNDCHDDSFDGYLYIPSEFCARADLIDTKPRS